MSGGATTPELDRRLAGLRARYGLPESAMRRLGALLHVLADDPLAPTAIREPLEVVDDHLADALVALELEQVQSAAALADLGAGPGVPGLPLAIALPEARVALVESAARKCAFLERAVARCEAANASVVHARAEAWQDGLGAHDLVTARALAPLDVVVEYAAPLLTLGGTLVAWRGRRDPRAEDAARRAAYELGLEPVEIRAVTPYPGARSRHLHVMSKTAETPHGFPRRPGIALKRPLGARPDARPRPGSDRSRR